MIDYMLLLLAGALTGETKALQTGGVYRLPITRTIRELDWRWILEDPSREVNPLLKF